MTHTYATKRLLEHGPLTSREVHEIAGWSLRAAQEALYTLVEQGIAVRYRVPGHRWLVYRLAA